ncbi:MAG: hypothetical protein ACKV22_04495 [Bryobacteraceae bacterium]
MRRGWRPVSSEVSASVRLFCRAAAVTAPVWIAAYFIHAGFPYLQTRGELVNWVKREAIESAQLFSPGPRSRLAAFGDSRTVCSFMPKLLDEISGGLTSSFNLGLILEKEFIGHLARICERGQCPTQVLAMSAPGLSEPAPQLSGRLPSDTELVDTVFPFRLLPKNLFVFLTLSIKRGGPAAFYGQVRDDAAALLNDRGYRLIEWLSYYPDHRLPPDFSTPSDTPDKPRLRSVDSRSPETAALLRLAERYGFHLILIPNYYRANECAPAADRDQRTNHSRIVLAGPDYWLFDNHHFSDPNHLNREGARLYTQKLWQALSRIL